MQFARLRRMRRNAMLRDSFAETQLPREVLMLPYFVVAGSDICTPIATMPGVYQWSVDRLVGEVGKLIDLGLRQVILFGVLADHEKDTTGAAAAQADAPVAQAVRALKMQFGDNLLVATDVCLCGTLEHGHCGVVQAGMVANDASLTPLANMALNHAQAGADIVAPSDMMDGRIRTIRNVLDDHGFAERVVLMSYSAKFASAYYGPFRDAAHCAPKVGNRQTYQMDIRNRHEALREIHQDIAEGADVVMIKPALAFLDIVSLAKEQCNAPLCCYNVSGEYAQVKAAAAAGYIDERAIVLENLTCMRRAGAQLIISYHTDTILRERWLG